MWYILKVVLCVVCLWIGASFHTQCTHHVHHIHPHIVNLRSLLCTIKLLGSIMEMQYRVADRYIARWPWMRRVMQWASPHRSDDSEVPIKYFEPESVRKAKEAAARASKGTR